MFNKGLKERINYLESKIQYLEFNLRDYSAIKGVYEDICAKEYRRIFKKVKKQIHKFKETGSPYSRRTVFSDGRGLSLIRTHYNGNCPDIFYIKEHGEEVIITKDQAEEIFNFVKTFVEV